MKRISGIFEGMILLFVWALFLSICIAETAQAGEDGWLVRQKNASPNGQWILRENGATELQPLPPGLVEKEIDQNSPLPPGFDRGEKKGWEKEGLKKEDPRTPPGFVDTRVYGNEEPRHSPEKPEKLDPYGHSKDDRKEETGNRGRVIRDHEKGEEPAPVIEPDPEPVIEPEPIVKPEPIVEPAPIVEPPAEEAPAEVYPDQLYTDSWTYWILKYAKDNGINPYFWLIELSGYSPLEAQFLMSHTMEQVYDAYSVTGEEDFLRGLIIENASWDLYTENLIADFQTYGSLVPAVPLTEEEMAAIIAYADPYRMTFHAGILKGFDDPRSIYRSEYGIDQVFSVNTVDSKTLN